MTNKHRSGPARAQQMNPEALELLDDVLKNIRTETEAPMTLGELESRQFLETLAEKLLQVRTVATTKAA